MKGKAFKQLTYPLGNETAPLPGSTYWAAPAFPWAMTIDGHPEVFDVHAPTTSVVAPML